MKLYQLPPAFAALEALAGDNGELPPDTEAQLDALQATLEEKLDGCCRVLRRLEREEGVYTDEATRLARLARIRANQARRLKAYMQQCLEALGVDRVDAGLFKVRLQANPPSVQIRDDVPVFGLPPEYRRVKTEMVADKAAILEAHKEGKTLPFGVEVVTARSLRIT